MSILTLLSDLIKYIIDGPETIKVALPDYERRVGCATIRFVLSEQAKERLERGVFKRFIAVQPGFAVRRWRYAGRNSDRPDFIVRRDHIGVELGEWLHPEQTRRSIQFDKYESAIIRAAKQRRLTSFLKSFKPSDAERYTVIVTVKSLPRPADWTETIKGLLTFLAKAPSPSTNFERRWGRLFGPGELPAQLEPSFACVRVCIAGESNLGIRLNRAASGDPEDAYIALEKLLHNKIVKKGSLYRAAKQSKALAELWLVVHYGRAFAINSPFEGIGIRQGLGADAETSLQLVIDRAHEFIGHAAGQPFDCVVMLWDFWPSGLCFDLWPKATTIERERLSTRSAPRVSPRFL